jgi:hypothetical protein
LRDIRGAWSLVSGVFNASCIQSAMLRLCSSCTLHIGCRKKTTGPGIFATSPSLLCVLDGRTSRPIVRRLLRRLIVAHSDRQYLCGSAYARAIWAPPLTADDRIAWKRWLKGLGAVIASTLAIGLRKRNPTAGSNRPDGKAGSQTRTNEGYPPHHSASDYNSRPPAFVRLPSSGLQSGSSSPE